MIRSSGSRGQRDSAALFDTVSAAAAPAVGKARPALRTSGRALSLVSSAPGEDTQHRDMALLVSGCAALQAALERVLTPAGCRVEAVVEPTLALRKLLERGSACVLLDLRVPPEGVLRLLGGLARGGVEVPVFVVDESGDVVAELKPVGAVAAGRGAASTDDHALVARLRALRAQPAQDPRAGVRAEALSRLTPRERDVLAGVVEGLSNKAIASTLGISDRTVEAHRSRLMAKLKAHSVASLVRLALENGGLGTTAFSR